MVAFEAVDGQIVAVARDVDGSFTICLPLDMRCCSPLDFARTLSNVAGIPVGELSVWTPHADIKKVKGINDISSSDLVTHFGFAWFPGASSTSPFFRDRCPLPNWYLPCNDVRFK